MNGEKHSKVISAKNVTIFCEGCGQVLTTKMPGEACPACGGMDFQAMVGKVKGNLPPLDSRQSFSGQDPRQHGPI